MLSTPRVSPPRRRRKKQPRPITSSRAWSCAGQLRRRRKENDRTRLMRTAMKPKSQRSSHAWSDGPQAWTISTLRDESIAVIRGMCLRRAGTLCNGLHPDSFGQDVRTVLCNSTIVVRRDVWPTLRQSTPSSQLSPLGAQIWHPAELCNMYDGCNLPSDEGSTFVMGKSKGVRWLFSSERCLSLM
jgi:hypothetical protein